MSRSFQPYKKYIKPAHLQWGQRQELALFAWKKKEDEKAAKAILKDNNVDVKEQAAALAVYQRPHPAPRANQNNKNMAKDVPCPACTFLNNKGSRACGACELPLIEEEKGKCGLNAVCHGANAQIRGACGHAYCTACLRSSIEMSGFKCPKCKATWRVAHVTELSAGKQLFEAITARLKASSPVEELQADADQLTKQIELYSKNMEEDVVVALKGELEIVKKKQEERRQIEDEQKHMKDDNFV